ncbi:AAA family ATPase [uncultured Salegentibacter sp.]|uniref:AAA family ATPase n=1 Tax=uncultured Salegentibacter sp. TaxID=259320 RepID=UPI0025969C1A|nr:AAA family ATPase [uncultured Salegentibacter sp.]
MIESLLIKNVASYDTNIGCELNDLKKVNFFFGHNGSGKSTIARYLHNVSLDDSEKTNEFDDCVQNGYDEQNHHILVFDENFIQENFNKDRFLKGVFSLNEANETIDTKIEETEIKIDNLEKEKTRKEKLLSKLLEDQNKKKTELLNYCWSKRNSFLSFSKLSLAHKKSKPNHLDKLREILKNPTKQLTIQNLTDRYNSLYENKISEISSTIDPKIYGNLRRIENQLEPLLREIIVGNEDVNIAPLIEMLNNRNWVEKGIEYLEKTDTVCPFCQEETIDDELRNQFNEYFDRTYKEKISLIEDLLNKYNEASYSLLQNILKIQNSFNPDNKVSSLYIKIRDFLAENKVVIENKIDNSNEKKNISSIKSFKTELSNIIKLIEENNKNFSELDQNKKGLISDIWVFMANKSKARIQAFDNRKLKYSRLNSLANDLKDKYDEEISNLKLSVESLRGQTVNTADAVNNINVILRNAGFTSFEIAEKDKINNISHYYLKRPGSNNTNGIFKSLSEGEKSFISFLYFYQLCIGTDDIENNSSKKKIIVIDDPVSSLDSQALFVISTLIHQLILQKGNDNKPNRKVFKNENIKQVFILTHNIYFYKEVSFNKRPICTDFWHYQVSKVNNKTEITGQYNKAVLDDYSLLWTNIKDLKGNLPTNSSFNISIANTMRRIIESYTNFLGLGNDSWSAILSEDQNSPEYYIKCAFISSINDESHKVSTLDGVYYQKISRVQPQLLFDIFKDIFESIGKEHYEMMMEEEILVTN